MTKRALISVSDKSNIVEFAKGLEKFGFEIISTGGTYTHLKNNGVNCISIEDVTSFPEILEGRVKTLHPKIHGGLLSKRGNELHSKHVKENNIEYIDLVCVNLYPFEETIKKEGVSEEEIIENIDIGGPSMLRSAAKNFNDVTVVTAIKDYDLILEELNNGGITLSTRRSLAIKVFNTTASYDAAIANYFNKVDNLVPEKLTLSYKLEETLRYGENPHQKAYHYTQDNNESYALQNAVQLHGKAMSYNNIQDASAALDILSEFNETKAQQFIEELALWDSHIHQNNDGSRGYISYYTKEQENANFVKAITTLAGYIYNSGVNKDNRSKNYSDSHFVRILSSENQKNVQLQSLYFEKLEGEEVYGIEVPSQFLVVSAGNKTIISGNCVHAKSYSSIFSTLNTKTEIEQIFEWTANNKHLQKKAEIIKDVYDNGTPLQKKVASVFLESFLFY